MAHEELNETRYDDGCAKMKTMRMMREWLGFVIVTGVVGFGNGMVLKSSLRPPHDSSNENAFQP